MMLDKRGSMAPPRMFYEDPNFCFATWNNVAIVDVWGDLDVPRMRKLCEGYRELLERYPKGIVAVSFIRKSTPVSTAAARDEITRFLKDFGERLLHHSMVIEADGVLGLMLRSVMRGVNAMLRSNRLSLHDGAGNAIAPLASFVATDLPRPVLVRELTAAIAQVRASHKPPSVMSASFG
jgi:hypothetical protein